MANLHAFVTDALTECLKVLISLDSFNIFRAQPIQSIQNTTAEWKTATTASRSLNIFGEAQHEAQQSTNFKHYMHQQTSTSINRIPCTQALLADSASALGSALPGHCIPLGVEVSFGKGLSCTAATETQI